ncbi:unnamed protein product, partial [Discosporangium mesarthrocarpum]
MIVVFIVDTNESMNAKTSRGCSLLDLAKSSVEMITKKRQDRSLLVTTEEGPACVRSATGDSGRFDEQLKTLVPQGRNSIAPSLAKAFQLLRQCRWRQFNVASSGSAGCQTTVDSWGLGRNTKTLDPGAVIILTDGRATWPSPGAGPGPGAGGMDMRPLMVTEPGSPEGDLCRMPYRWDHRVFTLLLRSSDGSTGME